MRVEALTALSSRVAVHQLDRQGRALNMPHGYPGTPVGDLFPLGQSVEGSGGSRSLRARQNPVEHKTLPL